MSSSIPDALIAAYFRDGQWQYELIQVVLVVCVSPSAQRVVRCRGAKRAPPPRRPSSRSLAEVLDALCAANLGDSKTLRVERNLLVRLDRLPLLSSCRVDGERFGRLAHWSRVVETAGAPNIVLYICAEKQFWVVSAKSQNTQTVNTRSAICWLRAGAGLGFCFDDERGVFRIEVSRRCCAHDDPWGESLAHLLSSCSIAFPSSTFGEN
jgi:hypothetical protein